MSPIDFASLLKTAREREGLTQTEAANRWDVPLRTLQEWEQGRMAPSSKHLENLLPILTAPAPKKARNRKRHR